MWRWDQGHLSYFDFDNVRAFAKWSLKNDLRLADKGASIDVGDLTFASPSTHRPWRQYARAFKTLLLVTEDGDERSKSTLVAQRLAQNGTVTCDEYFHFLVRSFTDPSPPFENWVPTATFRYPLLFALRYLLTKSSRGIDDSSASIREIVGAYHVSGFVGDETEAEFAKLTQTEPDNFVEEIAGVDIRQARESLIIACQISYLSAERGRITVSLAKQDARDLFLNLQTIGANERASNPSDEILRISKLFKAGSADLELNYPDTVVDAVVESGFEHVSFAEGGKVKRTHVTIERNGKIRSAFFRKHPSPVCHVCETDTKKTFPWTDRVLDLHHLLPLSSGTRIGNGGTSFDDLVAVCPTCHRAVHRFYDAWLREHGQKDFESESEARLVYGDAKKQFKGYVR